MMTLLYLATICCPENYESARKAFLQAASHNEYITEQVSLPMSAKGPNNSDLFIDIAVLGDLKKAEKVLFHISGTHGVEGGSGSGIQTEFLSNPTPLDEKTSVIFIHSLNPYGMAWNRRVNEDNIDLNRNCSKQRLTPDFYGVIDPLFNPKKLVEFDHELRETLSLQYGWPAIRKTLLGGQYDYPEGLFYGGKEIAEGPAKVLQWGASLGLKERALSIGVIDVHTGLGPYGIDTLLTPEPPSAAMVDFFGEKMAFSVQLANVGYKVTGLFIQGLAECIQGSKSPLFMIGQEFGTLEEEEVLSALYEENTAFHAAQRTHSFYDPNAAAGQKMLKAFYPEDELWRQEILSSGRKLIIDSLHFLEQQ